VWVIKYNDIGMSKISFHVLRIGTAITFLWIGVLIFQHPEAWGGYINPWMLEFMPMPIRDVMLGTAGLDMVIGALLLTNSLVWFAALIGASHLIIVLIASGINEGTVRDIAILSGAIALMIDSIPEKITDKIKLWKKGRG